MSRESIFNVIEKKINYLSFRISQLGRINLLNLHIHSETFFSDLMNLIFDYCFKNQNAIEHNAEGIDLKDDINRIVAQVSATCSKTKVNNSIRKIDLEQYSSYSFMFIAITGNVRSLIKQEFPIPEGITFNPQENIFDVARLLRIIQSLPIERLELIFNLVNKELTDSPDQTHINSNLAEIINVLANEDRTEYYSPELNSFEIERKIEFNDLTPISGFINDYKIYYNLLNKKYDEFDKQGTNRSRLVLNYIRKLYFKLSSSIVDSCNLFFQLIELLKEEVEKSENYQNLYLEEIDECVSIIVVDAFIKCKIFKNPTVFENASS